MVSRFEDVLARFDIGGVIQPGDGEVIREALKNQISHVAFMPLDDWEWLIGRERYPNWVGFQHLYKLLGQPGEQIHVYEMTQQANLENSRKSTQKSISRAVDALVNTQPDIGLHLRDNIKTGEHCVYLGTWDWRFAP